MKIGRLILWLAVAVGLLALVSAIGAVFSTSIPRSEIDNPRARVAMTAEQLTASQNPKGFQMLVSYTERGFEPSVVSVKLGDNVRFFNSSSGKLWISSDPSASGSMYPGVFNGCGSSAFDSCYALSPGEYWEFTFDVEGSWDFNNTLDKSKTGVANVVKR